MQVRVRVYFVNKGPNEKIVEQTEHAVAITTPGYTQAGLVVTHTAMAVDHARQATLHRPVVKTPTNVCA